MYLYYVGHRNLFFKTCQRRAVHFKASRRSSMPIYNHKNNIFQSLPSHMTCLISSIDYEIYENTGKKS